MCHGLAFRWNVSLSVKSTRYVLRGRIQRRFHFGRITTVARDGGIECAIIFPLSANISVHVCFFLSVCCVHVETDTEQRLTKRRTERHKKKSDGAKGEWKEFFDWSRFLFVSLRDNSLLIPHLFSSTCSWHEQRCR